MPKITVEKRQSLTGHKDCLYTLLKDHNSSIFYSAGGDGVVASWNLDNPSLGQMMVQVKNSVYAMDIDETNTFMVVGQNFNGLHLVNIADKKELTSSACTNAAIFDIKIIGDRVYSACADGQLIVSDLKDLSTIAKLKLSSNSLRSIAKHPTKPLVAIGSSDNTIKLLDLTNSKLLKVLEGHENSVFSVEFHPSEHYLISTGRDAHIRVWNSKADYEQVEKIPAHMYAINNICFSPDARYFASCSLDKSIKVWDAYSFRLLKVIDKARHAGHGTSVNKLIWTKRDYTLISASDDRSIALWDINLHEHEP